VRLVAKSRLTGEIVIDRSLEILDPTAGLCQFTREADEYHGGEICQAEIIVTFGQRCRPGSADDRLLLPHHRGLAGMTDITIAQAGTWPTYRLTLTRGRTRSPSPA